MGDNQRQSAEKGTCLSGSAQGRTAEVETEHCDSGHDGNDQDSQQKTAEKMRGFQMGNKNRDTGQWEAEDWIVCVDGIQILVEKLDRLVKDGFGKRLGVFSKKTEDLMQNRVDEQGYRLINGYRVREIFSGEESLTSLLTQYVARTVALHY